MSLPRVVEIYILQTAAVEYVFLIHDATAAVHMSRFQILAGVAELVSLVGVQPTVGIDRGYDQFGLAEREPRLFVQIVAERVGVHLVGQQFVVRHLALAPLSAMPLARTVLVLFLVRRQSVARFTANRAVERFAFRGRFDHVHNDRGRSRVVAAGQLLLLQLLLLFLLLIIGGLQRPKQRSEQDTQEYQTGYHAYSDPPAIILDQEVDDRREYERAEAGTADSDAGGQ